MAVFALSALATSAFAQVTWDTTAGDSAVAGGSGNWDTTTTNWTTDSGATNVAYASGTGATNQVTFGTSGTGNIVTLTTALSTNRITFGVSGYTLQGDSSLRTVTMGGTSAAIALGNFDATLGSNFRVNSSSSSYSVTGTGGTLTLDGGALAISGGNTLTTTANITVKSGGSISSTSTTSGGWRPQTGTINIDSNGFISATGSSTGYAGILSNGSGSATINVNNGGILTLSNPNTNTAARGAQFATGGTGTTLTVNTGGILTTTSITGAASASGKTQLLVLDGGTIKADATNLNTSGTTQAANFITGFTGSVSGNLSAFRIASGGGTIDSNGYTAATLDVTTPLTGSGQLTKAGVGTVRFTAANPNYSGNVVVSGGTLALGASSTLGTSASLRIASGATFDSTAIASFTAPASTQFDLGSAAPGTVYFNAAAATLGTLTFNFMSGSPDTSLTGYNLYDATGSISITSIVLSGSGFSGSLTHGANSWTGSANGYDFTLVDSTGVLTVVASSVPEPSTYATLAGFGVLALAVVRRRRKV